MALSDDFREQLKAGHITEAFALALGEAVELKITTWVASATEDMDPPDAKPGHRLRTRINMIEGEIENEIGEQLIAQGYYKELGQFHLAQVAESNKIIQSNLNSLQKLFELLVTLRYPTATPPVSQPESLGWENQLLAPVQERVEAGLVAAPLELVVEESVVSPNQVIQEDAVPEILDSAQMEEGFEEEQDEDDWDDSVLDLLESLPVGPRPQSENLDSVTDQDWGGLIDEEAHLERGLSQSPMTQDWEVLTREDFDAPSPLGESSIDDQDWGDFIEAPESATDSSEVPGNQLPEILPKSDLASPLPSPELNIQALDSPEDEDLGDLVEALNLETSPLEVPGNQLPEVLSDAADLVSPLPSPELNIEALDSPREQDWGWEDLVAEVPESQTAVSESAAPENQQWEMITKSDLGSKAGSTEPKIEGSISQIDDDWGDMVEPEPEPEPDQSVPSMDSLNLDEDDEEWDDWVVEEASPLLNASVVPMDSLVLEDDWGDFGDESDPFAATPSLNWSASELEIDEDWDGFAAEELEPFSALLDRDPGVEQSNLLADLAPGESVLSGSDHPEIQENLQLDSSKEPSSLEGIHQSPDSADDSMEVSLGETEQKKTQLNWLSLDDDDESGADGLFAGIQFEDFAAEAAVSPKSRSQIKSSADAPNVTTTTLSRSHFSTPEESDERVSGKDSDPLLRSEDELDPKSKPVDRRAPPPPPPPPSRFPQQNE